MNHTESVISEWTHGQKKGKMYFGPILGKRGAVLQSHLLFNSHIGQVKRAETIEDNPGCPFCSRHLLEEILDEDGSILLVKNKYPVLEDTFQTVLVETDDCLSELSLYPKEHLYRVLRFGIRNWFAMIQSGEYASVLFFKNHGPYSGGTIRHPHMQIVGLKHYDYHKNFSPDQFKGIGTYPQEKK